ncbi:MAG: zinc-ribbon domain-containing protein [Ruminococcus sp.]|nr:zinc-ribbon domain-containing protein [Ruminococcus sp.]
MGFMDSVKGFAEKVGGSLESGVNSVKDTTKKMGEKSKVKNEISKLEGEIKDAYFAIGKKYFEKHSSDPEAEYASSVEEIVSKTERVEKFKQLLASFDDKQACTNCGAEVSRGQKFCDKCGTKVEFVEAPVIEGFNDNAPENPFQQFDQSESNTEAPAASETVETPAPEAPAAKKFCTKCGTPYEVGQKFCDKCGNPLE